MPSRRRTANKNLSNNLAEVQRRLRTLERRPVRSKLGNRSVTGTAIGPNSVDGTQVSFGINLVAQVDPVTGDPIAILNPQDGQQVFDPYSGVTNTYSEEYNTYIETSATDLTAQSLALNAQASADGKNTIYRQSSAPTGGTYAVGDIWFDESNDGKINRWTVTSGTGAWSAFTLGDKAIGNINANHINAGTIDASVITVSNLDASKITAGTITGRTLKTSGTGRRIEITDGDDIVFYGYDPITSSDYQVGLITPIAAGWSDSSTDAGGSYNIAGGVAIIGSVSAVSNGAASYPNITVASDTDAGTVGAYLFGSAGTYLSIDSAGVASYGDENSVFQIWNDQISFNASYSVDPAVDRYINFWGPIAFQDLDNADGPLLQGSGIPSADGKYTGQIIFRYT
jgi:hypothetical protein